MSVDVQVCAKCGRGMRFERVVRLNTARLYGVTWTCECGNGLMEMCPLGPLVPRKGLCLNCGGDLNGDGICGGCGMLDQEARRFLRVEPMPGDPLADVRTSMERGLVRHAMGVCDALLEKDPSLTEAWIAKAQLLQTLGDDEGIDRMVRVALASGLLPLVCAE